MIFPHNESKFLFPPVTLLYICCSTPHHSTVTRPTHRMSFVRRRESGVMARPLGPRQGGPGPAMARQDLGEAAIRVLMCCAHRGTGTWHGWDTGEAGSDLQEIPTLSAMVSSPGCQKACVHGCSSLAFSMGCRGISAPAPPLPLLL